MIIVMKPEATAEEIDHLSDVIREAGLQAHISRGEERTVIGAIGDEQKLQQIPFMAIPGVESAMPIVKPYKLAGRSFRVDGLEATRRLRATQAFRDLPILACSASVSEEQRRRAREAGCDAFLPKPIRIDALLEALEKHLGIEWIHAEGAAAGPSEPRAEAASTKERPPAGMITGLTRRIS